MSPERTELEWWPEAESNHRHADFQYDRLDPLRIVHDLAVVLLSENGLVPSDEFRRWDAELAHAGMPSLHTIAVSSASLGGVLKYSTTRGLIPLAWISGSADQRISAKVSRLLLHDGF